MAEGGSEQSAGPSCLGQAQPKLLPAKAGSRDAAKPGLAIAREAWASWGTLGLPTGLTLQGGCGRDAVGFRGADKREGRGERGY